MRLSVARRWLRRARGEQGFTLAPVMIAGMLISMVVGGALAAVQGDLNLTRNDLDQKQAYEAARAGLNDYMYHLNGDTNYWTLCAGVPDPSAVNLAGSTAKRRQVPGQTGASYAIELLPASTYTGTPSQCEPNNPASMIETGLVGSGTFRIRSTGYAGDSKQSIVASFKRKGFLDYVYFTQFETSDPVTYGNPATIAGAYTQCAKTIADGRWDDPIPGSGGTDCTVIQFAPDDEVKGPFHTNDAIVTCNSPTFGSGPNDAIEMSAPVNGQGWIPTCGNVEPDFSSEPDISAATLTPPPTNAQLRDIAEPAYRYTCQVRIVLNGTNMTVTRSDGSQSTVPTPSNGVIYVENGTSACSPNPCSTGYSPYTAKYATSSACGSVYVRGSYSGKLTIAAQNDIIIDGNLTRTGDGMLGLIADNFIRVYHPYSAQEARNDCSGGNNGSGLAGSSSPNVIEAAILAIQHSFIVDHYDCGSQGGTLTVNGAIAQKFRGAVGTTGNTGYLKDYNYDTRLRYYSPPYFLDPVESAWNVQRETLDFPN